MGKMVLLLSFIAVSILLVFGIVAPGSPVMWLASTSSGYTLLRVGLLALLVSLILTNPPRHKILRIVVGVVSVVAAGWALDATYTNHMQLLDTMVILQVCISAGLIVLEKESKMVDNLFKFPALPKPKFSAES